MTVAYSWPVPAAGRPFMLASVTSAAEALVCLEAGADIIDAKDPKRGALGALAGNAIVEIRRAAEAFGRPVSATIGDIECRPSTMLEAVARTAATGVDFVKAGFVPDGEPSSCIRELGRLRLGNVRLVGVLFADLEPDFGLLDDMSAASFAGVLIDTADKTKGSLTAVIGGARLSEFIGRAHARGLFAGLAGSLRDGDIGPLCGLGPDILGFRGALCLDSRRTFAIDGASVQRISSHLDAHRTTEARAVG